MRNIWIDTIDRIHTLSPLDYLYTIHETLDSKNRDCLPNDRIFLVVVVVVIVIYI